MPPAICNFWALNCWFGAWRDICECSNCLLIVGVTLYLLHSLRRWWSGDARLKVHEGLFGCHDWNLGLLVPGMLLFLLSAGQSFPTGSLVLLGSGMMDGVWALYWWGHCIDGIYPRNVHSVPCQSPGPTGRLWEAFHCGNQNSTWLEVSKGSSALVLSQNKGLELRFKCWDQPGQVWL